MGDSDEDRRGGRRDKFRGERNDYDNRRPAPRGYNDRGRGDRGGWQDRKRDYYGNRGDNRGDRRDNFQNRGGSPPYKRNKNDGDDNQWNRGGDSNAMNPPEKPNTGSPHLMSFKDFVSQQEDDINEEQAVQRYQEYKVEFKRTQINDFFVIKKKDEWFEERYHPVKGQKRQSFIRHGHRRRLRIFLDLWEQGFIDELSLQITYSPVVLKLLDRVVILLEGGTEEDLKALEEAPKSITGANSQPAVANVAKPEEKKEEPKPAGDEKPKDYTYDADVTEEDDEGIGKEPLPPGMDEDDDDIKPPGLDEEEDKDKEMKEEEPKKEEIDETPKEFVYEGVWPRRPVSIFIRNAPSNILRSDIVNVCKPYPGFLRVAMSDAAPERRYSRRAWVSFGHETNIKDVCWNLSNIRVRELELSPSVNRDVTNRIRPINGIACSPMAMKMDIGYAVNMMKKLDAKLKLYEKEEELSEDEDEEETKEETNGHDENEEEKASGDEEVKKESEEGEASEESKPVPVKKEKKEKINIPDENPLLMKLPRSAHEVHTMQLTDDDEEDNKEMQIIVDEQLAKNLDLVLLYLRVVHCIDFYNANEYHYEDEMPMRCGIMHVRAQPLESANRKDVFEYYKANKQKLDQIVVENKRITTEEAEKLGLKTEDKEVEAFIKANTQELAKDKWLCPLSGKKFRGPEFVRKHIMMKHEESVEDVRKEVKYFNNYVYDLRRPCFPEARPRPSGGEHGGYGGHQRTNTGPAGGGWQRPQNMGTPKNNYQQSNFSTPQMQNVQQETYGRVNTYPPKGMNRRGGGFRDRKVIRYRDLDAPEESDFF